MTDHGRQIRCRQDIHPGSQRGLRGTTLRHDDGAAARISQGQHLGQNAANRAQAGVECQLADERQIARRPVLERTRRRENSDRDRQVEAGSALSEARGSQVHSHPALGKAMPYRGDGCAYPGGALAHGGLGKTHDIHPRKQGADADLDLDGNSVDAQECGTENSRQHEEDSRDREIRGGAEEKTGLSGRSPVFRF